MVSSKETGVRIRPARGSDAPQVARLFFETVHRVNARDYSPAQLAAWAPSVRSAAYWRRRLRRDYSLVAERDGEVLGFALLDRRRGYLDSFFVHHLHQGRGIGRTLIQGIGKAARRAGLAYLVTDASLTAEPFFRAVGFRRIRRQKRLYRGQVFRQYRMGKVLH